ncbi:methionine--tRNA ligase [Legionella anisa]|uniref:Methionine--tRNA ligase n=1 Tax=Legionella anisa TaxID=28082 RepID=A0AAX0WQA9_9GAMM|nr:methionine--tRNA ligase [Legionella anisa]AWN75557.1 methionine--tRNA ligase [Legionella anisa]KTC76345.1 methionyl-tRNA synthetase [Legionella anisa]MBN5935959.1 methionine--tRNA ligase [Legionella anisa]MCW8424251.1 methionine--tRNA ligase [Legionella anisa]MCW8446631.1 methionine--tRNA ligase [Legionella anisa]
MTENKKNYLLIPSVPTPNGRLHLGHIGGPFLSVDILARYLKLCGHSAWIISGTDSYESYAAGKAEEEHLSPREIGHYYHALIAHDLTLMDIQCDQFINPLDGQWSTSYQEWHEQILQQLLDNKATVLLKENMPWDDKNKRYLTGYWLQGNCPVCSENTTSYFCEHCGAHFRPEEMIRDDHLEQKTVENIFLELPDDVELSSQGIDQKIVTLFQRYRMLQNNRFRLTTQCNWGLADNTDPAHSRTLFSYGFVFAYFLMFGEIAGKLMGINKNAFAVDSDVVTISSFGLDNSLPFLSSALGISAGCPQYKSFDYYLINYFYYLDGRKFSTSRQHMIGVDEAINQKGLSSDIIRLYLASIDVRSQTGNFVLEEFILYYNKTIDWFEHYIIQGIQNVPDRVRQPSNQQVHHQLCDLFAIQENALQPDHFSPHIGVQSLNDWLVLGKNLSRSPGDYFWWLKGFTLVIYPYMPKLGKIIWNALGYERLPTQADFFVKPTRFLQKKIQLTLKRITTEFEMPVEEMSYEHNES